MLTSLPVKMNISLENALFLPGKERFCMVSRLFPVYLSCIYFRIPLSMKKILISVREFPPVPANGRKYAILGMREMQSVKTSTSMRRRFSLGLLHIPAKFLLFPKKFI